MASGSANSRRAVSWDGGWREKARYLDAGASLDALAPRIRALAVRLVGTCPTPLDALRRLHAFVRDVVHYVSDVGGEDFADSLAILVKGCDDCDGKSRLFCALARAAALECPQLASIECKILPVLRQTPMGEAFVHVQCSARGAGTSRDRRAEPGGWLLAELTLAGVPLGAGSEAAHRDALTGRLDVS